MLSKAAAVHKAIAGIEADTGLIVKDALIQMATPKEYWQRHPDWKDTHYGLPQAATGSTLGEYGCKLCDYALLLGITPPKLQEVFVQYGCYIASGYYNYISDPMVCVAFAGVFTYGGRVDCMDKPAPMDVIDDLLERNRFVLTYVDARQNMTPAARARYPQYFQHYILITGKQGNDYTIFDPYVGDIAPLKRYGPNWTPTQIVGGFIKIERVAPKVTIPPAPPPALADRPVGAVEHDHRKIAGFDWVALAERFGWRQI